MKSNHPQIVNQNQLWFLNQFQKLIFRRNRITAHELMMNKRSLRDSNFNIQAPTKIYIHGFSEHGRNLNAILLKNGAPI